MPLGSAWLRLVVLAALVGLAVPLYLTVTPVTSDLPAQTPHLFWLLLGQTLLYAGGVALVWLAPPATSRRWLLVELTLILLGGIVLRALVFPALPALSPDAYRYAWDPYLLTHGYSPYTHTPVDPALVTLRDNAIWPNLRFRNAPTIYPPGAQALFLFAYFIAPLSIFGVKAVLAACDALSAVLTLALLAERRLDPRRVLLYWWAPIPILEFALSGHIDTAAILWTLAAVLAAQSGRRGMRVLAGIFLGLAVLTKLYPLLFAIALVRRRDYGFLGGLAVTVLAGYLSFVPIGLGGGGFLETYFSQRNVDQGLLLRLLGGLVGLVTPSVTPLLVVQALALALLCGVVLLARLRLHLDPIICILALNAAWILMATHLFPWYVALVLPFLALLPSTSSRAERNKPAVASPPALGFWLFILAMPFTYVIFAPAGAPDLFLVFCLIPLAIAASLLLTAHGRSIALHTLRALASRPTLAEVRALFVAAPPAMKSTGK
jgi:hypothetical protein